MVTSNIHADDLGNWLKEYTEAAPTSSNQGVANLPFQRWFRFKEAFSPKFVADTLQNTDIDLIYNLDIAIDQAIGDISKFAGLGV